MNQSDFEKYLKELSISLTDKQKEQLEKYYELLVEYNRVMNLTGITEHDEVYLKHFYDSLTLVRVYDLNAIKSLCDIGTGAGFPGMVLKMAFPNLKVTLVDSLNKRIEFLKVVVKELGLENIELVATRVEEYAKKNREKFDVVTARAVASLPVLLEYSIPLVKVGGYFIPMKGSKLEQDESLNALSLLFSKIEKIDTFLLPKEDSARTLYLIKKEKSTPLKYPRKNSEIKKKSL